MLLINDAFWNFTFMLPYIVIDLFLNKQPDVIIIQIYSVIKLYMFRMELQFHPDSAWKRSPETCMNLASAECTVENS